MSVLRKDKRSDFTVIDNAIFRNKDLSLKAKGMLCLLLSLPDYWEFSVAGLEKLSTDGKSAVTSALNELEDAGYFYREQSRNKGNFGGAVYVISEVPFSEKPITENPTSENPMTENLPQLNTNISNTKESNTKRYRFVKPTIEEVEAYINEKGYDIDAHKFIDYYNANGWRVGKNPMRDWQATVRNWARNNYQSDKKQGSGNPWMDMLEKGNF